LDQFVTVLLVREKFDETVRGVIFCCFILFLFKLGCVFRKPRQFEPEDRHYTNSTNKKKKTQKKEKKETTK